MHKIKDMSEKERREGERRNSEKRETACELAELLHLAQEIGRRLANEVHGDTYDDVRKLNELLHDAHNQLTVVQRNLAMIKPG